MTTRVTFIVNGLGLGNSTRCHAVIEQIHAAGASVEVITTGNGHWYFKDVAEVKALHKIEPLQYGKKDGQINIFRTIGSAGAFAGILHRNSQEIKKLLKDFKPHLVVTDSEYSFRPMKKLGIPTIALNNSDVIYYLFKHFDNVPSEVKPQFYGVELLDYLFHSTVPNQIISPTLPLPVRGGTGKFHRVGPIVRKQFAPEPRRQGVSKVVIMLSGSVFGSPVVLNNDEYPVEIDIIGRPPPPGWKNRPGITYHGKIRNTFDLIKNADLAVVNGGFSAVSEMFAMHKPVVVIPVPRHAEQWINARMIVELGVGAIGQEQHLEQAIFSAIEKIEIYRDSYDKLSSPVNGAEQAAQIILELGKDAA